MEAERCPSIGPQSSLIGKFLPRPDPRDPKALTGLPRVVIVGAGFAGISCAAGLRNARASVTLIDRANFHLFQPLLYQVATAALSPGDIAAPVRQLFRNAYNVRVLLGTVTGVDSQAQSVETEAGAIPYDYLVLATGATHSYFGKDAWAPYAPGLKRIEDALEIRRKILTAFERAEAAGSDTERAALLTFLIVGGGPTGVELAGAIAELSRFGMDKEFRKFDPADARVVLVQSAPRLLPAFPESLAAIAQRSLEKLGVEVLLGSRVEAIDADGVAVSGRRIVAKTVLWAAGVTASPAAKWLAAQADNAGRIKVGADLERAGTHQRLRDRRYRAEQRMEWPAGAGTRAGGEAGRCLRGASHQGHDSRRARRRPRSATGISAASPRSGARPPSPISDSSSYGEPRRGGSGASFTSAFWSACATGSRR